jgi:diguanylate cyclase (GGDEF)-like protein/putative nucleotidyltransferase with HDIG domain
MKELTISTRIYLFAIYALGAIFFLWNLFNWQIQEPIVLAILCLLASLALIIKVEGTTNRSHYTFSFILFGFALVHLGIPEAAIVIFISNLVEWLVKRPPWFIQIFNTACYVIVINVAGFIFSLLNPGLTLTNPTGILAITTSMVVFTLLNHFIVGIIVWMARGENFQQSGIFDLLPLIIDLTLLTLGAMLVLIWDYSPFALLLFAFPIYLIYGTMRVPALERQSETDPKTGLYNHTYFKQHLENELRRANRFDRPLTIIMADLDLLRDINNTYGHLAGDEVLIGIANILKQAVREYDVVARFGGEEFTILMPETTLEQGYKRAEAIREAVEKAEFVIPTSVTPIKATLSLGVANREYFSQIGQDIIHNADTALYHSKLKGRNRTYAYTQEAYVDFARLQRDAPIPNEEKINGHPDANRTTHEASTYQAADAKVIPAPQQEPASQSKKEAETSTPSPLGKTSKASVYIYISGLFIFALVLFGILYLLAPSLYTDIPLQPWLGIGGCAALVILTEWYSIDLYTKQTSLSTSAVPILAGTLLFGPIGSFVLSFVYALSTSIKHRSPLNRLIFNFSNQLIAGMVYTIIIYSTGKPFIGSSTQMQVILAVIAAVIVYGINTALISIGMHLDTRQPAFPFWKEHYSWLISIYIGMGIVAAAFVFGYKHDPVIGSLLVIAPLLLLRISQVQYVERTRGMVSEMRVKNTELEKYSDEITRLNDGLLDTLAEIIDLRDPYVLGHSRGVTELAVKLAKRMGLHEKQIELIRRGSLLHDIGKLGISQEILAKPASLTPEEYKTIKTHPDLGAALLKKSPHLRPLIPIVRHHHEFYNGEGYPDKISENRITIEARIVSVADAIEAMSSDRPYRKARSTEYIIEELKRCSSTQFDPLVANTAIQILKEMESAKLTEEAIEYAKTELQKSTPQLRSFDAA